MWILIGGVVLFILYKFFSDWGAERSKVTRQGGMAVKYSQLITLLMQNNEDLRIAEQTKDAILLSSSWPGGSYGFALTQSFGKLVVRWETRSLTLGAHRLEWDFPENMDQTTIFNRMGERLHRYHVDIMGISESDFSENLD